VSFDADSRVLSSLLLDTVGGVWGDPPGTGETGVDVVRSTEFRKDGTLHKASAVRRAVTAKQLQRRKLRDGDILLEKSGGGPKQPVGRVAWVGDTDRPTVCANFVQLVRPDEELVDPRFLFYVMWFWHQAGRTLEFQTATTGIRNLRTPDYLSQHVPLPSRDEQHRLVALLDASTRATETALAYAATLEGLGRAQRQEVMTETWDIAPLGDAVTVTMGRQRSPKHAVGEHLMPYLRAGNVKDGYLALDDVLIMNFTPKEQAKFRLRPGDVMVTEGCGSLSQIGASARWTDESADVVCFQNTLLRLRAQPDEVDPRFLYHWARFAFESGGFAAVASGTNIFHIGAKRAEVMPFPCPPLDQQREFGVMLDAAEVAAVAARRNGEHLANVRISVLAAMLKTDERRPAEALAV
jgi:restriction endonuclease S subunit